MMEETQETGTQPQKSRYTLPKEFFQWLAYVAIVVVAIGGGIAEAIMWLSGAPSQWVLATIVYGGFFFAGIGLLLIGKYGKDAGTPLAGISALLLAGAALTWFIAPGLVDISLAGIPFFPVVFALILAGVAIIEAGLSGRCEQDSPDPSAGGRVYQRIPEDPNPNPNPNPKLLESLRPGVEPTENKGVQPSQGGGGWKFIPFADNLLAAARGASGAGGDTAASLRRTRPTSSWRSPLYRWF